MDDETVDGDVLARGRRILEAAGEAILGAAADLDGSFVRAVRIVEGCTGSVVVTGIGKAGLVARKISATLASTGTPSHFLHPAEALHGDLGALRRDDVVLALSQSGETEEVTRLLPHVAARRIALVAFTARPDSTLGRAADVVVATGSVREARRLMLVEEAMRPLEQCRVARPDDTVRVVFSRPLPARRTGAVMIVDAAGRLAGIFTDSDLARIFERRDDAALDGPIAAVMTPRPTTVLAGARLGDAVGILESRRLSELPVVDPDGRPFGLLDIVDLVGITPVANAAPARSGTAAA